MEMRVMVSDHTFQPLLREKSPSPAPTWGLSHGRQSSMNFSRLGPFCWQHFSPNHCNVGYLSMGVPSFSHSLLQHGSPTASCQETWSHGVTSLHGSTGNFPGAWSRECFPQSLSLISGIHPLQREAPPVPPPAGGSLHPQGHCCFPTRGTTGCTGALAKDGPHPLPPASLTLVSAGLFLSGVLTLLFPGSNYNHTVTLFLIKYSITGVLSQFLIGPSLPSDTSILELPEIASVGMEETSLSFSQKPPL